MRSILWLAILLAGVLPASARTIVVQEGGSIRAALGARIGGRIASRSCPAPIGKARRAI